MFPLQREPKFFVFESVKNVPPAQLQICGTRRLASQCDVEREDNEYYTKLTRKVIQLLIMVTKALLAELSPLCAFEGRSFTTPALTVQRNHQNPLATSRDEENRYNTIDDGHSAIENATGEKKKKRTVQMVQKGIHTS